MHEKRTMLWPDPGDGGRPYRNAEKVRDALEEAYKKAAADGVPGAHDVADAVKAWFDSVKLGD
jgi:hypothetical protein